MKKIYIQPRIGIESLGLISIIAASNPKYLFNDAINGNTTLSGSASAGDGNDIRAKERAGFYTGYGDDDLDY